MQVLWDITNALLPYEMLFVPLDIETSGIVEKCGNKKYFVD